MSSGDATSWRTYKIRKVDDQPRYLVEAMINEIPIKAFADTGADVCIMPRQLSVQLGLTLKKTKTKI